MNGNGDTKPPAADLEDPAFDSLETPYQLSALRHAIILNANAQINLADKVSSLAGQIRKWEETFQLRAEIMVREAAEQAGGVIAEKVLREILGIRKRVDAIEGEVEEVGERVSNADLKAEAAKEKALRAQGAAEASGNWVAAVATVPKSEAPIPGVSKKYGKAIMIALAMIAAGAAAAVEALRK